MNEHKHRSSFFWPILLIGVGAIILLRNLGILPAFSWVTILKFWPLLLVVLGLDILFGRKAPWFGTLVGLIAVGAVIAALFFAPSIGIETASPLTTETHLVKLENTKSVVVNLDGSSDPVNIFALDNSDELFKATITHKGKINFSTTGDEDKTINLSADSSPDSWIDWDLSFEKRNWDIGVSSEVPLELVYDGGSGASVIDLEGTNLSALRMKVGSGASKITLPVSSEAYEVEIESGSGAVNADLPEKTDLSITLDSGSGAIHLRLPMAYGLRIEVMDSGSGSPNLPTGLIRVSGGADSTGTWETNDYENAEYQITVKIYNRGSGSVSIN